MCYLGRLLIALSIVFAGAPSASAAPASGGMSAPPDVFQLAQYGRRAACANWQQQCANLYGWQTQRWQQCMGQPQAVAACSRRGGGYDDYGYGDYRGGGRRAASANWRQLCAGLYGWQTQRWYQCMGQPQAVHACS